MKVERSGELHCNPVLGLEGSCEPAREEYFNRRIQSMMSSVLSLGLTFCPSE